MTDEIESAAGQRVDGGLTRQGIRAGVGEEIFIEPRCLHGGRCFREHRNQVFEMPRSIPAGDDRIPGLPLEGDQNLTEKERPAIAGVVGGLLVGKDLVHEDGGFVERPYGSAADADFRDQIRIITIADIFDAVTANDRPYRKALSVPNALKILELDARKGALDTQLVDLFAQCVVPQITYLIPRSST